MRTPAEDSGVEAGVAFKFEFAKAERLVSEAFGDAVCDIGHPLEGGVEDGDLLEGTCGGRLQPTVAEDDERRAIPAAVETDLPAAVAHGFKGCGVLLVAGEERVGEAVTAWGVCELLDEAIQIGGAQERWIVEESVELGVDGRARPGEVAESDEGEAEGEASRLNVHVKLLVTASAAQGLFLTGYQQGCVEPQLFTGIQKRNT
jgi:hypothetical protein